MLSVHAPSRCVTCGTNAARGTDRADRPVCVSCALVGVSTALVGNVCETPSPESSGDAAIDAVVTALVGSQRTARLYEARARMHAILDEDANDLRAYNVFATAMVEAVREFDAASNDTLFSLSGITRLVNTDQLIAGATTMADAYNNTTDPVAQDTLMRRSYAPGLFTPVVSAIRRQFAVGATYRARALIAAALGPFERDPLGVSLISINGAIGEYTDRAVRELASFDGELRDMTASTVVAAFSPAAGEDTITLERAADEINAALVHTELADFRARLSQRVITIRRVLLEEHHARNATDEPTIAGAYLLDECAVVGMLVLLVATDDTQLARVLDRAVTELAARHFSGDRVRAATTVSVFFSSIRFPTAADLMHGEMAIIDAEVSDLVGSDALQHIDVRVLARAKERVERATRDKRFSFVTLRDGFVSAVYDGYLNGLEAMSAADGWASKEIFEPALRQQAPVTETPARFEDCIRAVAESFFTARRPIQRPPVSTEEESRLRRVYAARAIGPTMLAFQLAALAEFCGLRALRAKQGGGVAAKNTRRGETMVQMRRLFREVVTEVDKVAYKEHADDPKAVPLYVAAFMARVFDATYAVVPKDMQKQKRMFFDLVVDHFNSPAATPPTKKRSLTRFFRK